MKLRVGEALKEHFRPEFLNRVDDTIVFPQLQRDEILQIVDLMVSKLDKRLAAQGMQIASRRRESRTPTSRPDCAHPAHRCCH